jgi:hypothetical protein
MVMTAIRADKTSAVSGRSKVKPHWIPIELTQVLIWYLLVLRPLEVMVAYQFLDDDSAAGYLSHLWTGPKGRWTTQRFTALISKYTAAALGIENALTLSSSRQVLCGLYVAHCNAQFRESDVKSEEEAAIESIGDMQAGHTTSIARNHYAVELPQFHEMKERLFRALYIVSS